MSPGATSIRPGSNDGSSISQNVNAGMPAMCSSVGATSTVVRVGVPGGSSVAISAPVNVNHSTAPPLCSGAVSVAVPSATAAVIAKPVLQPIGDPCC